MRVEVPAVRVGDGITNNLSLRYTSDSGDFTQCRDGQATIASAALHIGQPAKPQWQFLGPPDGMEEEFETFEVDQQRELVMNATECNNIRLCIFIVDSDNLFTNGEINRHEQTFKLSKVFWKP